jgi:hypothetical protein
LLYQAALIARVRLPPDKGRESALCHVGTST